MSNMLIFAYEVNYYMQSIFFGSAPKGHTRDLFSTTGMSMLLPSRVYYSFVRLFIRLLKVALSLLRSSVTKSSPVVWVNNVE